MIRLAASFLSVFASDNWPDLAIGLYDRLTGRGAEITYEFDDMEVAVPSNATDSSSYANWKFNGTIRIKTRDNAH